MSARQRLVTYALGLAGGLGVNTLSNDIGYPGCGRGYRRDPHQHKLAAPASSRAPLTRIVSRTLLGGAAIAAILAAVNPRWEGPATTAAVVLTTSAVLIPTELDRAVELLAGIALIGVGVAFIGVGVAVLRDGRVLAGVAIIGFGVAWIGFGVAVLHDGRALTGLSSCLTAMS